MLCEWAGCLEAFKRGQLRVISTRAGVRKNGVRIFGKDRQAAGDRNGATVTYAPSLVTENAQNVGVSMPLPRGAAITEGKGGGA